MPDKRLQYLFDQYTKGTSTPAEKRELCLLVLASKHDAGVQEMLDAYWDTQGIESRMPEHKAQAMADAILNQEPAKIKTMFWKRIAVAASILVLIGLGSYFIFFNKASRKDDIARVEDVKDVKAPVSNRAMITLADGRTVYLDSAANGSLATQSDVVLTKTADGKIIYSGSTTQTAYNTLTNPRGSRPIDMQLADGSHVWLNAGSSVTYPVAFIGSERKLSITGEAYFEVSHDAAKPFVVSKGQTSVTVLGTHFNVNAYDDEEDIKVTLLEGSVKVNNTIIKPGQQARVGADVKVISGIDVDQVMAWRSGQFIFSGDNIGTIMRQLARWYDVDIAFDGPVPTDEFVGVISRSRYENISSILSMLEKTKVVSFKVVGRTVTVKAN